MPTHRIPRARLDEDLKELRALGERVVSMMTEDDGRVLVVTVFVGVETRDPS